MTNVTRNIQKWQNRYFQFQLKLKFMHLFIHKTNWISATSISRYKQLSHLLNQNLLLILSTIKQDFFQNVADSSLNNLVNSAVRCPEISDQL